MFTLTWAIPVEYPKGSVQNGHYWFTNNTLLTYATPVPGTGLSYTGTGETIEKATAALRTNIEAGLSKNRDKPVLEALKAFDKASK